MPDFTLTSATPHAESLAGGGAPAACRGPGGDRRRRRAVRRHRGAVPARSQQPRRSTRACSRSASACSRSATRARIDLPFAWTSPVQLALVPTLFLLPAWLVPLTHDHRGRDRRGSPTSSAGATPPARLLLTPGNAWFTVGPAAVLLAAGSPSPQDAAIALLVAMLVAQIGTDFVISSLFHAAHAAASRCASRLDESVLGLRDRRGARARRPARRALDRRVALRTCSCSLPIFGVLAVFAGERRTRLHAADRAQRRLPRHRAGARRGGRRRRRLHRHAHARRGRALGRRRRAARARRRARAATSSSARCCTTSARSRSPRRSSTSPARSTTPSGRSCAPTRSQGQRMLDRVGGFMREVGADRPRLARALRRRRLPRRAGRRGDPARGAHHHRLRRLQRDDHHAAVPRGDATPPRRPPSCVRCSGTQFDPNVVEALLADGRPDSRDPTPLPLAA